MVNYYELLEISQNADRTTIEQAIKKTRRLWNNRANNPDASIRAEAERHVREVAEAEKILLNDASRAEYDQQLRLNLNPTISIGATEITISPSVGVTYSEAQGYVVENW